jgi:hypothetical protein
MNILKVKITCPSRERLIQLLKILPRLQLQPDYLLRIDHAKEIEETVVEVYLTRQQLDMLSNEGFETEVVLDLAKIPDPRSYVAKENRYKEKLERLRREREK